MLYTMFNQTINIKNQYKRKVDKWVLLCCIVSVESVTVSNMLHLNSINYYCVWKTILSGGDPLYHRYISW